MLGGSGEKNSAFAKLTGQKRIVVKAKEDIGTTPKRHTLTWFIYANIDKWF